MRKARNLVKFVFQRVVLVSLGLLLQLAVLAIGVFAARDAYRIVSICFEVIAVVVLLYIVSASRANNAYKLAWIIPILALPVLGVFLYLLFGGKRLSRPVRHRMDMIARLTRAELRQNPETLTALTEADPDAARCAQYLLNSSGYPVCSGCETQYYSPVDDAFGPMLAELGKAERYIFLEYFIVEHGRMWDTILAILEQKAAQGVEVCMLYDDFGCIQRLPMRYAKELAEKGIRARVFNPYIPVLSSRLNNRDHRKLLIVDGRVAFTGGFNLADEYINGVQRFGHWKDSAICVRGEAAWSMTVEFLTMWKVLTCESGSLSRYRPAAMEQSAAPGFVQPFCDSPLDDEQVGENVYLSVIHAAKSSLRIMTPYLVIDEELTQALTMAAKSGVQVEIYTPGIPDKRYIQALSRAYYGELTDSGVKIFEYTPGFLHSKVFLADDTVAVVGTINLDFRSLYLHYEDAVLLWGTPSVAQVAADFTALKPQCAEYTQERIRATKPLTRLFRAVLRVFAPLM